jgi:hypothetical protein
MDQTSVIIILVCHDTEIINSILSCNKNDNFHILFVGDKPISDELSNNPRITVVRNLPDNIEKEKDLLTFTAWYAIIKNNLFIEYNYLCILEYDVILESNFETELIQICQQNKYDIISFIPDTEHFMVDIKPDIMTFFLNKKKILFKKLDFWFATTNHCLKRTHLSEFVDWYYPACLEIKKLDPAKISWYHERLFVFFIHEKSYNVYQMNYLSHNFLNSHNYMHNSCIDSNIVNQYICNPNCEFMQKFIDHFDIFSKLNIDFNPNCGSYLCFNNYLYTNNVYEKQKLLFNTAKKSKKALLIGNYMGHIAFIMLMANPQLSITCIDNKSNQEHLYLLKDYFKTNITLFISNNQEDIIHLLYKIDNNYDFIHISQQYPTRDYLNKYIDICIEHTELTNITFIADDYEVYSDKIIEKIKYNNPQCQINNELIVNGSNLTKIWDMKINKKYLLLYDDDTGNFKTT